jgi:hypothetical protein
MANTSETKTYLINFDDNLDQYAKNAADAKKNVDALAESNKKLTASGTASADEIEQSNAALRVAQKEYSNAKKLVDESTKARNAEIGSYEKLYRQWQLAQTQLKLMKDAYVTNADGTRQLSQAFIDQSKKVDNAKKALDAFGKGIHDNRLNVGNYSEAIKGALGNMEQLPGGFGRAASAVKGLSKQFMMLLMNPIVALIAAIAAALIGLFKAFKSTDTGATELAARFEQLKAIFDVIRQRAVMLVGALTSLIKGDFKKANEQFAASFTGIAEQMKNAADAGYAYQKQLDEIKDSEANYISQSADMKNAIAKLLFTAADRTKSTTERKKAMDDALAMEKEESETAIKYAHDKLMAEADYLAGKAGLRGDDVIGFIKMSDAEQKNASASLQTLRNNNEDKFKAIEEMYAKWIDADTQYYEQNKRNESKRSGFILELEKENAKARENARIEQLRKDTEAAVIVMNNELTAITNHTLNLANIHVESKKKQETVEQEFAARRLERLKIESDAAASVLEMSLLGQLTLEQQKLDAEYEMKINAANAVGASTNAIEEQYSLARQEIARAETNAKLNLALGVAADISAAVGEQTVLGKAAAVASTLITTYQSATGAFASFTAPPVAGAFSVPLGLIAAAAAVAAGIANVKKILAVKLPKGSGGGGGTSGMSASTSSMGSTAARVTAKPIGATTLTPIQSAQSVTATKENADATGKAVGDAVQKIPRPVVTVEDINAKTDQKNKVEVEANV